MRNLACAVALEVLLATPALALPAPTGTVTNLQAAFEAEMNAAEAFSSYARRAQDEGLPEMGRVFRALARAEQIHAHNHADVLRSLGAQATGNIGGVVVGTTRENLRAAIEQETLERDGRYPWWLAAAREIGDTRPLATLGVVMFVERAHVLLLQAALREIEAGRDAEPTRGGLCVSKRSGYVTRCVSPTTGAHLTSARASLEEIE